MKPKKKKKSQSKKKGLKVVLILLAMVVLVELAWFFQHQLNNSIDFPVQVALRFTGTDQACGAFSAWDLTLVNNQWIAVSDQPHKRILIFDMNGKFVREITEKEAGPPPFKELSGMGTDNQNHVYVVDAWNGMVRGFDINGHPTANVQLSNTYGPRGVAWNKGNFFVADTGTHHLIKVSPDGATLASWGHHGSEKGAFENPVGVAVDPQDNIYVVDSDNHRIQCLNPQGKFVRNYQVGAATSGVALDSQGRVYVSSTDGGFVKVFEQNGKYLGKLVDRGQKNAMISGLKGLALTSSGDIIASHEGEIEVLRPVPMEAGK